MISTLKKQSILIQNQLRKHWNLYLELFFVSLSCVMFYMVLHGHVFATNSRDDIFHWARLTEISRDLQHGMLPEFDDYTGYLGLATATFYPWVSLLPVVLIRMVCTPLVTVRFYFVLMGITCLNVAYWTSLRYWQDKVKSLLFAILVFATPVFTNLILGQGEVSGALAVSLLPMVFFGWLFLMRDGHWHLLAWGLVLITYTHLLTAIMSIVALIILTGLSLTHLNGKKMYSIIKTAVFYVLITVAFWVPVLILSRDNPLDYPHLMMPMNHYAYLGLSKYYIAQTLYYLVGISNIVGILFGFIMRKYLTYYGKRFYWLSVLLLLMNLQYLPWHWLETTPLKYLQFPYRVAVISNILLMMSLVPLIYKYIRKSSIFQLLTASTIIVSIIFCIMSLRTLNEQGFQHIRNLTNDDTAQQETWTDNYLDSNKATRYCYNADYSPKTLTTYVYNKDMVPGLTGHSRDNYVYSANLRNQQKNIKPINNGFIFTNTTLIGSDFRLPITTYKGQKYDFYCNGKRFYPRMYQDSNPVLKHMPTGTYTFTYQTPVMSYRKISILISSISLAVLVFITVLPKHVLIPINRDKH